MNMMKRILAFVLCLCMLVPMFGGVVGAADERVSTVYDGNIGRKAKFDLYYTSFPIVSDPTNITADQVFSSEIQIEGSEIPAGLVVKIVDCFVNEAQGIYWYRIEAANGHVLPEVFPEKPWVFQNYMGSVGGESLIFLEEEPEVTEPEVTEPEVTEPEVTEPEVTEPEGTEPEVTEPEVTEPEGTEPEVTEPEVTEPEVTEPEPTEPEPTEPEVTVPDPCPVCGIYSCGKIHLYCHVCDRYECDLTHTYCGICGGYDCGLEHEDVFTPITAPVIPERPNIPEDAEDVELVLADAEGNLIGEELLLVSGKKTSLSAWSNLEGELSYQWQVCYDLINDRWVNIQGETGKGLLTSPAMFAGVLKDVDYAMLRCVITSGDQKQISDPITIRVVSENSVYMMPRNTDVEPETGEDTELERAYLEVLYLYQNDTIAAAPHVAELTVGMEVNYENHIIPKILGYQAKLVINPYPDYVQLVESGEDMKLLVKIPPNVITGHVQFVVRYMPTLVNYTVSHYKQNVTGYDYTKDGEAEHKTALTGTIIENIHRTYDGFHHLIYETPPAAADNSTSISIFYDRNYYLMKFDLGGGYGVDPIYDRYEAEIQVGEPKRPGYTFEGCHRSEATSLHYNVLLG